MVRAFSAGNRFNRRKGRERSKALSHRKALGCCGALPKVQQGSIEQGKASNRHAEKAVFVMACLYSLYKHNALIDSFQRKKSGQFPTPQQTYHLVENYLFVINKLNFQRKLKLQFIFLMPPTFKSRNSATNLPPWAIFSL